MFRCLPYLIAKHKGMQASVAVGEDLLLFRFVDSKDEKVDCDRQELNNCDDNDNADSVTGRSLR